MEMEIRSHTHNLEGQIQTLQEQVRILSLPRNMYSPENQEMGEADAELKDQLKTLVP